VSTGKRDLAARYLDGIARLLPAARSEWGQAMRGELASIDSSAERRRFALGCTRALLLPAAKSHALWRSLAAVGALSLALGGEIALTNAIGPAVPVILTLAVLAWLGRRPGFFGPVQPDRVARAVRSAGYGLAFLCLLPHVIADTSGLLQPSHKGYVFALVVTLCAGACVAMTARASRLGSAALSAGVAAGIVAGLAAFVVLPFERSGTPLADGLPGHGRWLALIVFGAPAAAALVVAGRTRRGDQPVMAALCAGAVAALSAALLGLNAIALFPDSVPKVAGRMMLPGTSAAARHAEDVIVASDPYAGLLVFGALLAAILLGMARPPTWAGTRFVLLAVMGIPPVALALSARHSFPGAAAIAFCTAAVVLAGALTASRRRLSRARLPGC
jgi:hypothetical protein